MIENQLVNETECVLLATRVYLPGADGYYNYERLINPDALLTDSMCAFYKDELWATIEPILMEYANDRHEKARNKAGIFKRIVRRFRS